jgi:GDP-6-deoxy-D-talose 4-dehydrogenase
MSRILITGHDGFTGHYLWQHLERSGHELFALNIDGRPVDLRQGEMVEKAVQAICPEKIIHLAAISSVDHADIKQIYDVNLWGTRNLLQAAEKATSTLETIVIASSANIYGNQSGQLSEAAPVSPLNDYAVSKAAVELLAETYRDRLPIILVRPFNYTGAGQSTRFIVSKIIDHLRTGKAEIHLGNLDIARDFSDVRDICHFYAALASNSEAIGRVYNLCSGRSVELKQILEMAFELTGRSLEVIQDPQFMRNNDIKILFGDPAKINKLLGIYKRYDLRETLAWMLEV